MDTVGEVKNLKKQLKKLKRTSGNADQLPESEFSLLEKECRKLISNSTSVFNTVNILMRRLFTEQELYHIPFQAKHRIQQLLPSPNLILQNWNY